MAGSRRDRGEAGVAGVGPQTEPPTLVGREAELRRLSTVFDPASDQPLLLIRGEAGIGKSTLLEEALRSAPQHRLRIYRDGGQALQESVPFALVADVFKLRTPATDEVTEALARIVMGVDQELASDPFANVLAVTEGLVDLLTREAGGVAVVIDDLHWADRASLAVVDRLLRRAGALGLRMIMATRPTARADVQAVTARLGAIGGHVLDLDPLSADESLRLLGALLGERPGPQQAELAHGAGGNPLYIAELAAALRRDAGRSDRAQSLPDGALALPSSFRAAVVGRVGELPRDTVAALRSSAILGTSVDVNAVAAVLGSTPLGVLADLHAAIVAGLLVERDATLAFRHELVRAALYDQMPLAARLELHRVAAGAVRDPGAVAAHLEAAGPPFSDADLDRLERAAAALEPVDASRAAELLGLLLDHSAAGEPGREELQTRRASCLVRSGDLEGAASVLAELDRRGRFDLELATAVLEGQGARDEADAGLVARLAAAASEIGDRARHLEVLGLAAYHGVRADPARFRELLAALPVDDPAAPTDARIHLMLARATRTGLDGDLPTAISDAERAYALAKGGGAGAVASVRAGLTLGVFGGDIAPFRPAAVDALEHATRWAEDSGQVGQVPASHALLANAYWADGDWDAAEAAYRSALAAAEETENHRWYTEARCGLTHMAADRGRVEEAQEHLAACKATGLLVEAGGRTGAVAGPGRNWLTLVALEARIAYADRRDAEAIARWSADVRGPDTVAFGKAVSAMDLTVAALTAGDRAPLEVAAEALQAHPVDTLPAGMVRQLVIAALDGDAEEAGRAAERARPAPAYGFAKMAEAAGLVALGIGDAEGAVGWLREALATWERCGAKALSSRTAASLRRLGVAPSAGVRARPSYGWDSLTEAERRVVPLVAEGLLYREAASRLHLSRRTVETHVASSLRKLGLRNRAELAAAYWRHAQGGEVQ